MIHLIKVPMFSAISACYCDDERFSAYFERYRCDNYAYFLTKAIGHYVASKK